MLMTRVKSQKSYSNFTMQGVDPTRQLLSNLSNITLPPGGVPMTLIDSTGRINNNNCNILDQFILLCFIFNITHTYKKKKN
jgi:hypothetical protein